MKVRTRAHSVVLASLALVVLLATVSASAGDMHTSSKFSGIKVNAGTVTHTKLDGRNVLTLSDDFQVPDAPDPHWQVVDSRGTVYLLGNIKLKGDRIQKTITLPDYIPDVAKVQIYCSWAQALLGEASFSMAVK